MARELDLPFVDDHCLAHLRVAHCEHGGWDLTMMHDNEAQATHIHCRNWQQVECFRIRLLAKLGIEKQEDGSWR